MGQGTENVITEVNHLLAGRLVIPSIQRGYVWKKSQVPELLDSLYRGFPVGSLLVWHTNLEVPLKRAAVVQDQENQLRPSVLLDGQQRLTSLAKVVAPERVIGGPLDLRFDVDNEVFLNATTKDRNRLRLVSVTDLLADSPQLMPLLAQAGVQPTDHDFSTIYDRIRRVHEIRRYDLPVTSIDSDDYEVVAEIFARVNQGGRRLSKGDLVYSAIAARWTDGLETIDAFNERLDRDNFALDREAVLRLTSLLAGSGAHSIKLIGKQVSGDDLKRAWHDTERALEYAVDFLKGECSIPRSSVLSSPNVIVLPAYLLFRRQNQLSPAERSGLRRWVYTAMAFSYYSNQVEGKLDADARLVREHSGEQLMSELLRRASGPRPVGAPIEPDELATKKSTSSWFNLLYIAALRRRAADWYSNLVLSARPMSSNSKIEYHHIFPKARVQKQYGLELTNQVANLAFISGDTNRKISARSPENYLKEIEPDRLVEQWIPPDRDLWSPPSFPLFLAHRREALAAALNDLLGLRSERSSDHMPPSDRTASSPRGAAPPEGSTPAPASFAVPPVAIPTERVSRAAQSTPRRDIQRHVSEVFASLPPGTELTIGEVAGRATSQYPPGSASAGAIAQLVDRGRLPDGLVEVPGRPRRIAKPGGVSAAPEPATEDIARTFHQAMLEIARRAIREVGYRPTAFLRMVEDRGAVTTAHHLVAAAHPSDGFTALWEAGRLDLAAESLVAEARFASLFAEDIRERAVARLHAYGYLPHGGDV